MAQKFVKFLMVEEDGQNLEQPIERLPVADECLFSVDGWTSQNVRDAILEALVKASVGSSPENFSYNEITGTITIPASQQMRVYQELSIRGELTIRGEAIIKEI
jgi:hypothetical protein